MSQSETDPKDGLRLRARLRYLYHGGQPAAVKFRLTVIVIDFAIIAFFLAAPILKNMGHRIVVHGTGLIPYVATFMDVETPDIKVSLYEKIRREIHGAILLFLEVKNSPQLLGGSNAGIR